MFAAVYGLLYGDHHDLHRRLVDSLVDKAPELRIKLWCNQVCRETLSYLSRTPVEFIPSEENVGKYVAMRRLFEDHIPEKWVIWFDDDSHVVADDWLPHMKRYTEARPGACYIGQSWNVNWLPGEWNWIRQAEWFRGLPPALWRGSPGVSFAQGSYWWLRTDILRLLDWPDPRMNHNGGDTKLAEAVRQNRKPFHSCAYGVKVNDQKATGRRGFHEAPAGCLNKDFRR